MTTAGDAPSPQRVLRAQHPACASPRPPPPPRTRVLRVSRQADAPNLRLWGLLEKLPLSASPSPSARWAHAEMQRALRSDAGASLSSPGPQSSLRTARFRAGCGQRPSVLPAPALRTPPWGGAQCCWARRRLRVDERVFRIFKGPRPSRPGSPVPAAGSRRHPHLNSGNAPLFLVFWAVLSGVDAESWPTPLLPPRS